MKAISIKNKMPFPLEKGRKLRAMTHLTVIIPVDILSSPDTPLGEVIRLSNDAAEVGVARSPQGTISAVIVAMRAGDEISLGRSAEIAIDDVPEGQAAFEDLSS
jgi:hypothetical protein